ncbi:GTP-binding protein [Bacillus aerolatus]|uniref:GTP-binding protein n=1 Tax=Bacillus aerolatus TaxID=2653354 RepID=A0A6I1FK72_9BACI|nr:GTP-binding protein [Bacillus aerolatus]KAB7709000.1 GTP-binding protein [Bacillus aerolatus]
MKKHVYVLSGFLGSGKTTLLKQLLVHLKGQNRRPAVLMNELGDVSIDSAVVEEDTPLKELLNGCICCTVQEQLESQLQELLFNETFDDLIIETTGAAHPVEAIDAIMSPLFADQLEWKGILTTVDCLTWKKRAELPPAVLQLMYEQIKHADLLVVNKTDLVSEMDVGTIAYEIQQINAERTLYAAVNAKIPMKALQNLSMSKKEETTAVHAHHHLHLSVFSHTFTQKVNMEEFEQWVRKHSETIFRMKGYVPVTQSVFPMLFQYSYGMPLWMPEEMNMPTTLVIIGEQLNQADMKAELTSLENV